MKLIIGLGNPGKNYSHTRHNVGFIVLDEIQKVWHFPNFALNQKFKAEISQGVFKTSCQNLKILLIKPQVSMNRSGETVSQVIHFYKLTPQDIIVIHDDLDIEIGKYKTSIDLSSAGHKGVQSIIDNLGTSNFKRIRLGIEKLGGRKNRGKILGEDFVLQNFTEKEIANLKKIFPQVLKEII